MHLPVSEMPTSSKLLTILAGKLFDPYTGSLSTDKVIAVSQETGLVIGVQSLSDFPSADILLKDPGVIDLREQTVLPGFVDVHVHCKCQTTADPLHEFLNVHLVFLHPYSEVSWEDQVTRETLTERTVRATVHARRTLMAGFTAVR